MKKFTIVIIIIVFVGLGGYLYLFQGHRDIIGEKAAYTETVESIKKEFNNNTAVAYKKYLNKTIVIGGVISECNLQDNSILLEKSVYATFAATNFKCIEIGHTIKIKGRFLGYDALLDQFKLDQSSIVK